MWGCLQHFWSHSLLFVSKMNIKIWISWKWLSSPNVFHMQQCLLFVHSSTTKSDDDLLNNMANLVTSLIWMYDYWGDVSNSNFHVTLVEWCWSMFYVLQFGFSLCLLHYVLFGLFFLILYFAFFLLFFTCSDFFYIDCTNIYPLLQNVGAIHQSPFIRPMNSLLLHLSSFTTIQPMNSPKIQWNHLGVQGTPFVVVYSQSQHSILMERLNSWSLWMTLVQLKCWSTACVRWFIPTRFFTHFQGCQLWWEQCHKFKV